LGPSCKNEEYNPSQPNDFEKLLQRRKRIKK
jgi:splicing factor 45